MAPKAAYTAPDFDKRVHFNTVRVKPEYRISLRMGNIEDLFANEPGEILGRMERLQVLGLFYFPLEHQKAQIRFPEAWWWFRDKLLGTKDNTVADKAIQNALKCRVVSGAKPPGWNDAPSGLPVDAKDPMNPAPENFAKIRIPGGYTIQSGAGSGSLNEQAKYKSHFIANKLYQHETDFYNDNPALGKIPLVATVEKRLSEDGPWVKTKDVSVHFQLLPAYPEDKPAFDPAVKSSEQFARPPLGQLRGTPYSSPLPKPPPTPRPANYPLSSAAGGPKKKIDEEEAKDPTGKSSIMGADRFKAVHAHEVDPQGRNAHLNRGGKRGKSSLTDCKDVAGVVFSIKSTPGFNTALGKRKLPHKDYPVAEPAKPDGYKHVHAVRAKTNEDGEAGVIFMPSRCGGDRYRIRAYIGPPTSVSHGAEVGATEVTTGTFVVWRNLRLSRIILHEVGAVPDQRLTDDAKAGGYPLGPDAYLQKAHAHDGTKHVGLHKIRLDDPDTSTDIFRSLPLHFAPAFCEVEFDAAGPETLTADEWKAARQQGVDDSVQGMKNLSMNLDLDALYFMDIKDFAADATVCALTMRTPKTYNAKAAAGKQQLTLTGNTLDAGEAKNIKTLTENYCLQGFLRHLTKNGSLPGLTLVYSGMGYTWQLMLLKAYGGLALSYRGAFLWFGDNVYTNIVWPKAQPLVYAYDGASNASHELGHVMFQPHGVERVPPDGGAIASRHDDETHSACVMSYGWSNGQFCGLSLLSFRGWDVG